LVWLALSLAAQDGRVRLATTTATERRRAVLLALLVVVQVVLGALVAGTKAGLTYNTWPLMDGHLVPPGLLAMEPWWLNLGENVATIQFDHRMLAYAVLVLALWHAVDLARRSDDERMVRSAVVVAVVTVAQAALGIATLLAAQGKIPIGLGLAHQGGGAIVWAATVWHLHRITR
jgi:cytochrome c oxidase assembly protein subunit 15